MSLYEKIDDIELIYPALKLLGDSEKVKKYIDEIEEIREKTEKFLSENTERINKAERESEKNPYYFDYEIVKSGGKYNFFSLIIPREFGGQAVKSLPYSFMIEDMSAVSAGVATVFGAHSLGLLPVLFSPFVLSFSGFLKRICESEKNDPIICALGLTEPTGGSDVQQDENALKKAKIVTKAQKVKGGYIINGRKVFISNGSVANYVTVAASPEQGKIMWFLVDTSAKGFHCPRVEDKMGQKTSPAAELVFEDVFVPDDMVLSEPDYGANLTETGLGTSRAPVGAIATGIAKGIIKKTVELIGDFDEFSAHSIAQAISKLFVARNLWISACIAIDFLGPMYLTEKKVFTSLFKIFSVMPEKLSKNLGRFLGKRMEEYIINLFSKNIEKIEFLSSVAKIHATTISCDICSICMDILSEKGIIKENVAERFWRDIKLTQIYETANEVNNLIAFRKLFGAHSGDLQ